MQASDLRVLSGIFMFERLLLSAREAHATIRAHRMDESGSFCPVVRLGHSRDDGFVLLPLSSRLVKPKLAHLRAAGVRNGDVPDVSGMLT